MPIVGKTVSLMVETLIEPEPKPSPAPGMDTAFAVQTGRTTYYQQNLDTYERMGERFRPSSRKRLDGYDGANLVSSQLPNGMHKPVIDCDYPVVVIDSTTPGHGHLYIEQKLTWDQYKALLRGFYEAGLIQKKWYENAVADGRSYVRLPHVKKARP